MISTEPFFSVIMAAKDASKTIVAAITSLSLSTFKDYELIIVDDCSSDDTAKLAMEAAVFLGIQDRVSIITLPVNIGPGLARNRGLVAAKGAWITFLDSDDTYAETHLESRRARILENSSLQFIWGGINIKNGSSLIPDINNPDIYLSFNDPDVTITGGLFITRSLLNSLGGFKNLRYHEDGDLLKRLKGSGAPSLHETEHFTYNYDRSRGSSIVSSFLAGIGKRPYVNKILNLKNAEWESHEEIVFYDLFKMMSPLAREYAHDTFVRGMESFFPFRLSSLAEISDTLFARAGWRIEPVKTLIKESEFYGLLARKMFPVAMFIRRPEEFHYVQEPDVFHETFGHIPLLLNESYRDFVERFAKMALTMSKEERRLASRLFWRTVEFGLVRSDDGEMKILGAGILSSFKETMNVVKGDPVIRRFAIEDALSSHFYYDRLQDYYFYLNSLDDLTLLDEETIRKAIRLEASKTIRS